MVRRFELDAVSHSAAVFDVPKLAWMNRHYMKERPVDRLAPEAAPYFRQAGYITRETSDALALVANLLPMAVGSVDRLDEIPGRLSFVFDWHVDAATELARLEGGAAEIAGVLASEFAREPALDRERFRNVAGRVRERTGLKGRALFHPIRVIVTGAESGPELDLAVPAIEIGARVDPDAGVASIHSCAERARLVASALGRL
jgi:glutamyl/glutaminyl-tRNA synthetase